MKALIFAAALLMSGCASVPGLPTAPPSVAGTNVDEKALYGAELMFNAATRAIGTAVDAGVLRGAQAARAADLLAKGYAALKAARTAQRAGNASAMATQFTEAMSFIAQLRALPGVTA